MPLLLAALGLTSTGQVAAQTFMTLHNFTGADGVGPFGLVPGANTLYGTTGIIPDGFFLPGFPAAGMVFSLNKNGTGFTNLYKLSNGDGWCLNGGLVLSGNTLFGTAARGGSNGYGTLFALNADGTGFRNVHTFTTLVYPGGTNSDGASPSGGLILSGNTLYGTAAGGGCSGAGTVFALQTDGTDFAVIHTFTGYPNEGEGPGGLTLSDNTFYGTTGGGGSSGRGTVFAVNTDGTGFKTLHSFATADAYFPHTNSDGTWPGGLILSGHTLYGTALYGGSSGNGTVFALHTDGTGFTNLHSFTGLSLSYPIYTNSDGTHPYGNLVIRNNTLYGTANRGGAADNGTVFAINTDGTAFTTLHSFTALSPYMYHKPRTNSDGSWPAGALVLWGNNLYGVAAAGGNWGYGTVFNLSLGLSPPTIFCSPPLTLECSNSAAVGTIQAQVHYTNGYALQVFWTVDGSPSQTNNIPSGGAITASNVTFTANFELGEHVVMVSASNGRTDPATCSTTVTVHDTTPPQILKIVATPNALWPPNHRMIPVNLVVEVVDNCDPAPVVRIISLTSNEPQNPFAPDWEITGALSLNLRAERFGKGPGRIYTIVVQCQDLSGNVSTASVHVTVPHN